MTDLPDDFPDKTEDDDEELDECFDDDEDGIIAEIHAIRRRIWARFDNDPRKVVEHYMKLQEADPHRVYIKAPKQKLNLPPPDET